MTDHFTFRAPGLRWALALMTIAAWLQAAVAVDLPSEVSKQKPFHEIWAEEVPVMGHLAVARDGTVLIFKENREARWVDVKRSEDGGKTWSQPIVVGTRVKIGADMSDDGRYPGEHVGWSELANVTIDENTGDIMVFAAGLKPAEALYRSRDHGKTWATEKIVIRADKNGWQGTTYCCDPGITLRHGKHKGRLLMPSQVFVGSINKDGTRTYLNKGQGRKYFAKRYSNALYSGPGRRDKRDDITVHVSFDRGESWPVKRIVKTGPGNYTWMAAGRKGTPSEGMIYRLSNKDWMARFNLAWLLQKQKDPSGK